MQRETEPYRPHETSHNIGGIDAFESIGMCLQKAFICFLILCHMLGLLLTIESRNVFSYLLLELPRSSPDTMLDLTFDSYATLPQCNIVQHDDTARTYFTELVYWL